MEESRSGEPDLAAGARPELPTTWGGLAQPVLRDCSFGGSFCEQLVLEAILEYANFHNLEDTSKALSQALRKNGCGAFNDEAWEPQGELRVLQALQSFDEGHTEAFFRRWRSILPSSPSGSLELRLHVHFGIYKMRKALVANEPGVPLPELDFGDLKAFLSSRPSGDTHSLSSLFALPFVPRPHENSALRFIFEDSWLRELRRDVQALMTAHACTRHAPALRQLAGALLVARAPKEPPPSANWHELLRISDLALNAAGHALQSFPNASGPDPSELLQWLSVGGRMLPELQKQGLELRRRFLAVARRPERVETRSDWAATPVPLLQDRLWTREARGSSASSLGASNSNAGVAKRLHSARSIESRARTATALLPVPPALDFGRIATLLAGEVEEKMPPRLSLLRAVLRRLALPDEAIRPRRAFLAAFACFGALGTLAAKLPEIIASDNPQLLEMSLAVMGVCACEVVGRREIEAAEADTRCISALISVATASNRSLTHMHCLAVLQRLSLRGRLQSKMIHLGALDVVLKLLESVRKPAAANSWCRLGPGEGPETPDFSIEFTSALLMNLTLRSAGRKRCADLGAYGILVPLIEHPNAQVRTHINGTLYTLLGVKAIRAEALKMGAEAAFRSALERVSPENELLRRQLEFLLHQLHGDSDSDAEESDDAPEPEAESDADDGDNFLDEEELAAHFHLASTSVVQPGDGYSQADIDANTKAAMAEAAAAEEVLRCFRASATVSDSQQRRFHTFVARSCRNLMSPKRRNHSSERLASPLSPVVRSPGSESPGASPGSEPCVIVTHEETHRPEASEGPGLPVPEPTTVSPRGGVRERPESRHEDGKGRGRGAKGRGRGKGGTSVVKSSSLPPLPENKASSRAVPASGRAHSEAPKRGQQAKASIEVAVAVGEERGFRKRSKPPERQTSRDQRLPELPKRR